VRARSAVVNNSASAAQVHPFRLLCTSVVGRSAKSLAQTRAIASDAALTFASVFMLLSKSGNLCPSRKCCARSVTPRAILNLFRGNQCSEQAPKDGPSVTVAAIDGTWILTESEVCVESQPIVRRWAVENDSVGTSLRRELLPAVNFPNRAETQFFCGPLSVSFETRTHKGAPECMLAALR
jgi:hypothetical protein